MEETKHVYFIRHITHKFLHFFVNKGVVKSATPKTFILTSGKRIPKFPKKDAGYVVFDSEAAALKYFKEQADIEVKKAEKLLARTKSYRQRLFEGGIEVREC